MKRAGISAIAIGLVALATIVGAVVDPSPDRPVVVRGRYRVVVADLHAHTRFSDGFLSPFDLVVHARRQALDVLAVTEHDLVFPAQWARVFSRAIRGPAIVVGEEVTTPKFHVIGLGLDHRVSPRLSIGDAIDAIHAQGGVAIAAHPVALYQHAFEPVRDRLDGAELMHPIAWNAGRRGFRWPEMRDFALRGRADGTHLTLLGSSDYHAFAPLGLATTDVFVPASTADADLASATVKAIRRGDTVVFDRDEHAYGAPALVELLRREPLEKRRGPTYAAVNLADAIARIAGLLGLLGVVFARIDRGVVDGSDRDNDVIA